MATAISECVEMLLVFGREGKEIRAALESVAAVKIFEDLGEIVDEAVRTAEPGDIVLFSPACASFDMFENYQVRGDEFKRLLLEKLS